MNSLEEVSVVDIYDLASEIGKEFEKIIDKNGPNSVIDLIPKVINVLELLEAVLIKRDNEDSAVQELRDKIAQLETDKLEKAELKKQNDKLQTCFCTNKVYKGEEEEDICCISNENLDKHFKRSYLT
ncbi:RILP-like protein homolog isoform X2 [Wyeomyia smithii]|uniref:RILP-like protein homolog isoform X2 n=1 Tax=Wyeomyia smithii TaxID=174621 RepID=UPI002467E0E9|nr:RILP-like protein homolog isoform X2 [Wyeomyia smithii]